MSVRSSMSAVCAIALACGGQPAREASQPTAAPAAAAEPAPSSPPPLPTPPPVAPISAQANFPVKWSSASALELKSASDAHARYLQDEPDTFGELEGEGTKVRPTNCVQWSELHAKAYAPTNGVEETPDSGAKLRCATLALIERARPAERSYVRDLSWDRNMLPILPVDIATSVHDDDERAIAAARGAGKSFKQFDPKARAKPTTDKETLEIIEGDKTTMVLMYPMVWGDFDADGTDDMAMAVVNGATQGTLAYSRLLTVTRTSAIEMLRVIESR